ncbi:hypothetical protein TWF696_003842 [Orbilia brochopaga]|uniref:Elongation of fatty acids protein n=1 Tax=Orbilia brochopaga TaxID=3140254 RepID=A0AAV9V819_9PEZI
MSSLPIPTLDRPFGIHLWPIFSKVFELVVGYPAEQFEFVHGKTPISTLPSALALITVYYLVIFGGKTFMADKKALRLNALFQIHNVFLTFLSGSLLALAMEQLIPILLRNGLFYGICNYHSYTQKLVVIYYLNYLTKYFELLDTVFLFLKKKPLTFLHTYHHGATALLCYTQLVGTTSVQWVPITINLFVHVVMYWYYFLSARGIRVWWKEWITRLQIAQFVIDLVFVYFASYTYFMSTYFPWMPNAGECAGEEFAALAGMGILSSYLVLFISFYLATYKKSGKRAARKSISNGTISLDPKFSDAALDRGSPKPETKAGENGLTTTYANGDANGELRARAPSPGGPATRSRKA